MFRTAATLIATVLFTLNSSAVPALSADSAILIDGDTGAVLFAHHARERSLIASTTKIMTAVVVLEHCDPEMAFTVPAEAVGIEGSSLYLAEGEVLTVRELLYGLMLHSGNDAAVALALACSDSVPEFVALMNLKAQELGMVDSHFENPSGLDGSAHYSTAEDLANLTSYALKIPLFREIVSTKSVQIGARHLTNHNKLLWMLDGVIGVKTGYTREAGRILVSAAEQKGRQLIAVTIDDRNDWEDHKTLYHYGFNLYEEKCFVEAGQKVTKIPLLCGKNTPLIAGEDFYYCVREGEKPCIIPAFPRIGLYCGEEGSTAGYGWIYLGQKKIGQIELLWGGMET